MFFSAYAISEYPQHLYFKSQKSIHFNLSLPLTLSVHVPQPDYSVCENHFISYQPKEGKKLITDKINTCAISVPYVMVY